MSHRAVRKAAYSSMPDNITWSTLRQVKKTPGDGAQRLTLTK